MYRFFSDVPNDSPNVRQFPVRQKISNLPDLNCLLQKNEGVGNWGLVKVSSSAKA